MLQSAQKRNVKLIAFELVLFCCIALAHCSSQPPYQVALYLSLHPRAPPIHYCNGVIVHSRLILTTATCTYYQLANEGEKSDIPPSKISVVPGAAITYNYLNTFDVLEINIARGFNSTTLANNLALIRLDTSLPLGQREDVKWIILDDYEYTAKGSYMAGFPSLNIDSSIMLLENIRILPNEQCAPIIRNVDICGQYPYAVGPDCEFPNDFPAFNSDYGTGLIHRSNLIALFSHTVLTNSSQNCHEHPLKAIFTTLGAHLDWIYGIIAKEEMLALNHNGFTYSAPYQQNGNSAIKFITEATESTTAGTEKGKAAMDEGIVEGFEEVTAATVKEKTEAAVETSTTVGNATTTTAEPNTPYAIASPFHPNGTEIISLLPSSITSGALAVPGFAQFALSISSLFLLITVLV